MRRSSIYIALYLFHPDSLNVYLQNVEEIPARSVVLKDNVG